MNELVLKHNTRVNDILAQLAQNIPSDKTFTCFEHLFVFIEEAFWVYNDICRQRLPFLPSYSLKEFADTLLQYNASLLPFYHGLLNVSDFDQMTASFAEYKRKLPRFGACILNAELDSVVLVKERRGGWGFPRGKQLDGESEEECAIREVREEIGFDIRDKLDSSQYISLDFHGNIFKLFVVVDVPKDTTFSTTTRHEIQEISWHTIALLPQYKHGAAKNFYMTIPFVGKVKEWILMHTTKTGKPLPKLAAEYDPRKRKFDDKPNTPKTTRTTTTKNTTTSTSIATPTKLANNSTTSPTNIPTAPIAPTTPTPNTPKVTLVPLKKRKLEEPSTPTVTSGIQFVPANNIPSPKFSNLKPPKSWLMEWCQKNKVAPLFSRESTPLKSTPGGKMFTVTVSIPAPYSCTFTSSAPSHSMRDAENMVSQTALQHLDKATFQQMQTFNSSAVTPNKLTCTEQDDPFSVPGSIPADPNQEVPQQSVNRGVKSTALPPKATENPISFLKELCDKRKWGTPYYETVRTEGPPHLRLYVVEVSLPTGKFRSDHGYTTIQLARKHAALAALQTMEIYYR